jgi:hypothetical protein
MQNKHNGTVVYYTEQEGESVQEGRSRHACLPHILFLFVVSGEAI